MFLWLSFFLHFVPFFFLFLFWRLLFNNNATKIGPPFLTSLYFWEIGLDLEVFFLLTKKKHQKQKFLMWKKKNKGEKQNCCCCESYPKKIIPFFWTKPKKKKEKLRQKLQIWLCCFRTKTSIISGLPYFNVLKKTILYFVFSHKKNTSKKT